MIQKKKKSSESAPKKLKIASDLYSLAYKIKRTQLSKKFPSYSSEKLHEETLKSIERGCTE